MRRVVYWENEGGSKLDREWTRAVDMALYQNQAEDRLRLRLQAGSS